MCSDIPRSKPGKRCRSQAGGSDARPGGDSCLLSCPFNAHAAKAKRTPAKGATTDLLTSLRPMSTLEQFKEVRMKVSPEVQQELFTLMTSNPDDAISRMVEIAAEKGLTVSKEEVRGFLREMDDSEEFDDIELDAVALVAIAGGKANRGGRC